MIRYLALLLQITMIAGCSASRPMPVVVEVVDAMTMAPVEDVVIRADGGTFYIPTMQPSLIGAPGTMFGPLPDPEGRIGQTNQNGRAFMEIAGQRPVAIRFFKTGYWDGFLMVEAGEDIVSGAIAWTQGIVSPRLHTASTSTDLKKRMMFRVRVKKTDRIQGETGPQAY